MAQSYKEYTGSELTATTFSVPFKYLSINDVNALGFDGTKWNALALHSSTPRDAVNKTITLAAAPNTLYTTLRLYRATSTTQLIDFQNGSRLSESDLDAAYQQSLFVAQEIAEDASTTQFAAVATAQLQAGTSLSNFASQEMASDGTNGLINGTNAVFNITAFAPQTEVKEAYRVSIDGVMQSPTDAYTISMSPAQITFTSAPPVGSKIVVVTAASAASAVSVDDVTIGLTSANKAEIKDLGVSNAKLAGSITQDKLAGGITQDKLAGGITNAQLAGSITQDKLAGGITNAQLAGSITQDKLAGLSITNSELAGSIATSKLAEVIDDDTMTTGVSATSLASSKSIKAYVDNNSSSTPNNRLRIKVLPDDFNSGSNYSSGSHIQVPSGGYIRASTDIPAGYKATHFTLTTSGESVAAYVYEVQVDDNTLVSKGSSNATGTRTINITDVTGSNDNYLVVVLSTGSGSARYYYGGYFTLAAV